MQKMSFNFGYCCSTLQFSKLQQVQISLIARRLDLLTRKDTRNQAASHISISPAQNETLKQFFEEMYSKSSPLTHCEYHPLIMVVEEVSCMFKIFL